MLSLDLFDSFSEATLLAGVLTLGLASAAAGFIRARKGERRTGSLCARSTADDICLEDSVTGALNKQGLQRELRRRAALGDSFAFFYMDLDRFAAANEQLGRGGADQLLKDVASRLRRATGGAATIARIDADQFIVLAPARDLGVAANLANGLVCAVGQDPYRMDDAQLSITASAGVALYPYHGEDLGPLMGEAETALYQAKSSGGARSVVARNNPLRASQPARRSKGAAEAEPIAITRGAA